MCCWSSGNYWGRHSKLRTMSRTEREEVFTSKWTDRGKGDMVYRGCLMWSHIDWPTLLQLKQWTCDDFPPLWLESGNSDFNLWAHDCFSASFVTFPSLSSQITRNRDDSCRLKEAKSVLKWKEKDKEADLFVYKTAGMGGNKGQWCHEKTTVLSLDT